MSFVNKDFMLSIMLIEFGIRFVNFTNTVWVCSTILIQLINAAN